MPVYLKKDIASVVYVEITDSINGEKKMNEITTHVDVEGVVNTLVGPSNLFYCTPIQCKILDARVKDYYQGITIETGHMTEGSAGFDLRALTDGHSVTINPGERHKFHTGIAVWVRDNNYAGIVLPRSGLGTGHGIRLSNSAGLIDADYQGELNITLHNDDPHASYTVENGERIAQLIIVPVKQFSLEFVDEFHSQTKRGGGGHGSTGRF